MSIKRALLSVYDKTGIIELAQELNNYGVELLSTGGTFNHIREADIPVREVTDLTNFPEMMDGRVKTLHPYIHGGILAVRTDDTHMQQAHYHEIPLIDIVVVNFYPFQQMVDSLSPHDEVIENIDIGGPAMVRSAAKNYGDVLIVVDPSDYSELLDRMKSCSLDIAWREELALKAFAKTAAYDASVTSYFTEREKSIFPKQFTTNFIKSKKLRYGENPHQQAAYYKKLDSNSWFNTAEQLAGKELSYNNICDADAAIQLLREFAAPVMVAVKHTNPCGVATGNSCIELFSKVCSADPTSIFGGIIACNLPVNKDVANEMKKLFLEVIIAPSFTEEALSILQAKKNLRLLLIKNLTPSKVSLQLTSIDGDLLLQEKDRATLNQQDCKVVTERHPDEAEWQQLMFAWQVAKHVKSNAIVLVKNNQTIGIGAGQMNRVGAAEIAIKAAGDNCRGAVLASDAFFPMADTVEKAAEKNIAAIIQPGGSIRDAESIEAADKHGISMIFTGIRHFKH